MNKPQLRLEVWAVLRSLHHIHTPEQLIKRWYMSSTHQERDRIVSFQCMDGIRPGMAGEIRDYVYQYQRWQRQLSQ